MYANLMEVCSRAVRNFTDNMTGDFEDSDQAMFGALAAAVDAHVLRIRKSGTSIEIFDGLRDPPVYITKNRKQTRTKDAHESGRGNKRARRGMTRGRRASTNSAACNACLLFFFACTTYSLHTYNSEYVRVSSCVSGVSCAQEGGQRGRRASNTT